MVFKSLKLTLMAFFASTLLGSCATTEENKELAYKIEELEREQRTQNHHISIIYSLIDKMFSEPVKPKNSIGFTR